MQKTFNAPAKVNIGLTIGKTLPSGKKNLESIIYPINLSDEIVITKSDSFSITSNIDIKDNIIIKVVNYFQKEYNIPFNFNIKLIKNIPTSSGLGGGSSNASLIINFINDYYKLELSQKKLIEIAKIFGTDTVFSLFNRPSYVYGDGTDIRFIDKKLEGKLLLVCFKKETYTKDMFKKVKESDIKIDLDLYSENPDKYYELSDNSFLYVLLNEDPTINKIYKDLIKISKNFKLTGSGSTLYLYNYTDKELKKIRDYINKREDIYLLETSL